MIGDCGSDGINLRRREAPREKELAGARDCIRNVIPASELGWIRGAMSKEYTKVMHPSGGEENIVVEFQSLPDTRAESVKPWLVAEFVDRTRFATDVIDDRFAPVGITHADSPFPQSTIGARLNTLRSGIEVWKVRKQEGSEIEVGEMDCRYAG